MIDFDLNYTYYSLLILITTTNINTKIYKCLLLNKLLKQRRSQQQV